MHEKDDYPALAVINVINPADNRVEIAVLVRTVARIGCTYATLVRRRVAGWDRAYRGLRESRWSGERTGHVGVALQARYDVQACWPTSRDASREICRCKSATSDNSPYQTCHF
ncbi:hypothetical protein Bcep1808_6072 [Burkholderia vietnamiensis G4]|uniref:Uncharacterized protein n=1 Tax=Burkholderia vietnamiensis (strain G4 / LMG 22486) TaxID=269482 RepID=A4JRU1_BURVG|nr:hypothetical protein Bcep1808_6072 [Burkholderia vietnamiensis G4]